MKKSERKKILRQKAVDKINDFCTENNLNYKAFPLDENIKTEHNEALIVHYVDGEEHSFLMSSYDFIERERRCPKCNSTPKKTIEKFRDEVYGLVGDEYTILSDEYNGNKIKMRFRHNKCRYGI